MLPSNAYIQLTQDLQICRLLNGMWQVSGAHGAIEPHSALRSMTDYHRAGYTTWDLADHYGPAEDFIGLFRQSLNTQTPSAGDFQALTKWVPRPAPMPRQVVEQAVNISRRRMAAQTLDMIQFHWWDYHDDAYLDALEHLAALRDQGWMRHVALTNFDTAHVQIITERGIGVVSNQVQFSIIDRRPEVRMIEYCGANGIALLPYGTVCGGLISERYLGAPEPTYNTLNTASLRKYKNMIDTWGGWALFQRLLTTLKHIAVKHDTSIATIAIRYILDKPTVAGVIIGARLGVSDHRDDNARVFGIALDDDDRDRIHEITAQARDLYAVIGDCGDEYRR
jgi:aryl-alcohol dehydrogenase-like predicted oxidoreductase